MFGADHGHSGPFRRLDAVVPLPGDAGVDVEQERTGPSEPLHQQGLRLPGADHQRPRLEPRLACLPQHAVAFPAGGQTRLTRRCSRIQRASVSMCSPTPEGSRLSVKRHTLGFTEATGRGAR